MAVSLAILEKHARYIMGTAAIVAAAGLGAFKIGWISTIPPYKENAWYLVGGNSTFVITNEYADEAACRRKENGVSVCRSGKALLKDSKGYQTTRS